MDTPTSSPTQAKTVLIVEDEKALLSLLTDTFTTTGMQVLQASNGIEGFEQALQKHPDLILLDIMMPEMDGMTMMKKLREDPWGKTVPIIILTNVDPDNQVLTGVMNDQPAYYIIKSDVKVDEIIEKAKEILAG